MDDVEGEERHCEFSLPAGDFYDLMMTKRLDPERGSSPGWLDEPGDEDLDSSSDDSGGKIIESGVFLARLICCQSRNHHERHLSEVVEVVDVVVVYG